MVELNPLKTVEELMRSVEFEEDGSTLKNWQLFQKGLVALPESMGDLTLTGHLYLRKNQLTKLPESFGSLTVGGDLDLFWNQLRRLP